MCVCVKIHLKGEVFFLLMENIIFPYVAFHLPCIRKGSGRKSDGMEEKRGGKDNEKVTKW